MENELLLNQIKKILDELELSYTCAEGGRIIVQFNGMESVCLYHVLDAVVLFRTYYNLGDKVSDERRNNVLEKINKINPTLEKGVLYIDEEGCIEYSDNLIIAEMGDNLRRLVRRALHIALRTRDELFDESEESFCGTVFEGKDKKEKVAIADLEPNESLDAALNLRSNDEFMMLYKKGFDRVREELYGDDIPDNAVLNRVYEGEQYYKQKKCIKNYAIMGGPGSGKTTLAKKLAKFYNDLINEDVNVELTVRSVADLKGAHIGHTGIRVFNLLKEASEKKQIIFIDEAYQLLSDEFGREALSILLPIMSGDTTIISKPTKDGGTETFDFNKSTHGWVPPIWLGGYEKEVRKMIAGNKGLYRRLGMIVLSEPEVEDLYQHLNNLCKDNAIIKDIISKEENKKVIEAYFSWGMQKEHIAYFACYAGVETFYDKLSAFLSENMPEGLEKAVLSKVIKDSKQEIEKQCSANE